MMAILSSRNPGNPDTGSSLFEGADLNGTRATEPIKASGNLIPHKQAGHMTALDHANNNREYPLPKLCRPHMTPDFGVRRRERATANLKRMLK